MPNVVVPNVLSKDLHRDVVAACGPDCFIGTGITDNLIPPSWSQSEHATLRTVLDFEPDLSP